MNILARIGMEKNILAVSALAKNRAEGYRHYLGFRTYSPIATLRIHEHLAPCVIEHGSDQSQAC
jgi:hypothetical protein